MRGTAEDPEVVELDIQFSGFQSLSEGLQVLLRASCSRSLLGNTTKLATRDRFHPRHPTWHRQLRGHHHLRRDHELSGDQDLPMLEPARPGLLLRLLFPLALLLGLGLLAAGCLDRDCRHSNGLIAPGKLASGPELLGKAESHLRIALRASTCLTECGVWCEDLKVEIQRCSTARRTSSPTWVISPRAIRSVTRGPPRRRQRSILKEPRRRQRSRRLDKMAAFGRSDLQEEFIVHVLELPVSETPEEGDSQALALVILRRRDGLLLCVPHGYFSEETLAMGLTASAEDQVGQSTVLAKSKIWREKIHLSRRQTLQWMWFWWM